MEWDQLVPVPCHVSDRRRDIHHYSGHHDTFGNASEYSHEHFGIVAGEREHIQYNIWRKAFEFTCEFIQFAALTDDAIDSGG